MKISERDKILLIILLIAAILGGSYYVFDKISKENKTLEDQVTNLSRQHSELVQKNANKKNYESEAVTNNELFTDIFTRYTTSLSQEQTLLFLSTVEKNTGVWLKQQSLEHPSEVYQFGRVTSSNPSKSGQRVYTTDNKGISVNTSVSYECTYDQLKTVLTYLRENGKKVTINSMSYSYNSSVDMVTGTMSLTIYAITGSDREPVNININDVFVGTDNIFNSSTFIPGGSLDSTKDRIVTNYDMYLVVNKQGSDKESVICGQSGDINGESVISSTTEGIENVTIKVTGREGSYRVSYQVGARQYPAENYDIGAALICGEEIDLLIISSERGGMTDSNEINLKIINETDISVNAAIINDDTQSSRINVEETTGNVVFYQ